MQEKVNKTLIKIPRQSLAIKCRFLLGSKIPRKEEWQATIQICFISVSIKLKFIVGLPNKIRTPLFTSIFLDTCVKVFSSI